MAEDSLNRRYAVSFQSGAMNSTSEVMMIPCTSTAAMNMNMNMIFPGNSSFIGNSSLSPATGFIQPSNSSASPLLDSMLIPGLKHDSGLAVEWSVEEQYKLEQGLLNYANEPNILKYIKIAATLHDKTVRDVAMRCRWMTRKRRKADEHNLGKKVNNRKDKLLELNSKMNMPSVMLQNDAAYPVTMHHMDQNAPISLEGKFASLLSEIQELMTKFTNVDVDFTPRECNMAADRMSRVDLMNPSASTFFQDPPFVIGRTLMAEQFLGISGTTRHLLEQNALAFSQITANISTFKDNIELFCRTRNNITAILNDMRQTPGIMSQMPPLPESINENLANSILPHPTQSMMFGSPIGIQLKQEPRC